jgi:twinkle protein
MTTDRLESVLPHGLERVDDLSIRTSQLYKQGLPRGDPPGWRDLNELYSVKTGQLTVITGYPGSGKSEFLDAMLVNLADKHDWHFAFYSPEGHPTETHVARLLEKRIDKPFFEGPTPRMTLAEMEDGQDWVHEKFAWMNPEYKSYQELLATAETFRRPGAKKFGVVLDPWNTLEHKRPRELSETEYIGKALTDIINWIRRRDIHLFLVVHPAKMGRDPKTGVRPIPTPYDLAGSANFYNKADSIICIHRDQVTGSSAVRVFLQKVRFKYIGHVGEATLFYDRVTGNYRSDPIGDF